MKREEAEKVVAALGRLRTPAEQIKWLEENVTDAYRSHGHHAQYIPPHRLTIGPVDGQSVGEQFQPVPEGMFGKHPDPPLQKEIGVLFGREQGEGKEDA